MPVLKVADRTWQSFALPQPPRCGDDRNGGGGGGGGGRGVALPAAFEW
jgi:hypothetical protein